MPENSPGLLNATRSAGNLLAFLEWVAVQPRTYEEAMDAWRTSCPRLSAWEDAISNQLVRTEQGQAATQGQVAVLLTEQGEAFLGSALPTPTAAASHRGDDIP